MSGSLRKCEVCQRPFKPADKRSHICSASCAAKARWADRRATAELDAQREAELATLVKAKPCPHDGEYPTMTDELGDVTCVMCGRAAA